MSTPGNYKAQETGSDAIAALQYGVFYTGAITEVSPHTYLCAVHPDDLATPILNCVWGIGYFSPLLGLQSRYRPVVGTRVLVANGPTPVIVATLPSRNHGTAIATSACGDNAFVRDTGLDDLTQYNPRRTPGVPGDLLDGELDMTNAMGVGLQIMTTFSKFCAGDRVKIETHLLNDMIRVVSDTWRHHSAIGDEEIYDDGRLNYIWRGTSYPHEAWGLPTEGEPKCDANADEGVDFTNVDAVKDTGRWRVMMMRGWLGGLISTYVMDPAEQMGRLAADALQAGRYRHVVTPDGTSLTQSVTEIVWERVTCIPVPIQLKRPEDPTGVTPEKFATLNAQMLKLWQAPKTNVFETAFQMRQYARYLSQYMSMCRFLQMDAEGEWKVVSEAETPVHKVSSEPDVMGANSQAVTYDTYSTIRMMRDGSLLSMSGEGSTVMLGGGHAWISAPKNVHICAGGDIVLNAGQNIYATARRNFEISALVGGLKLKARTWWHALCELGSMWLKSDADDPNYPDGAPAAPQKDDPSDPDPLVFDQAVLVSASRSCITVDANHTALLQSSGSPKSDDVTDRTASVLIRSAQQHVDFHAQKALMGDSQTDGIVFKTTGEFLLKASAAWLDYDDRLLLGKKTDIDSAGRITTPYVDTEMLRALRAIQGPDRPRPSYPPSSGGGPPNEHGNHIDKIQDGFEVEVDDPDEFDDLKEKADALSVSYEPYGENPQWRFSEFAEYVPSPGEEGRALYQSHAQQWISSLEPVGFVTFRVPTLLSADRTDRGTASWPGNGAQHKVHTDGDSLSVRSSKKGADFLANTPLSLARYERWMYLRP